MSYIVFDLEWNQSPNGKEDSVEHLPFRVIEIGIMKLNGDFEQTGTSCKLTRPKVYGKMRFKISEVTHTDMAGPRQDGESFDIVMNRFFAQYEEEEYCFCIQDSMDLIGLQRNMAYRKPPNPFPRPLLYLDAQKPYCLQCGDEKNKIFLDVVVRIQGVEGERPPHRVLDDAYCTGYVLSILDMEAFGICVSVDYYGLPRNKAEEYRLHFPKYSKYASRESDSREGILKDRGITDTKCVKCNRMLRRRVRWLPYGQRFYFRLAVCLEHGRVEGKIRVKKSEDDHLYAVKTAKVANTQDVELLTRRRKDGQKRRSTKARRKAVSKPLKGKGKQDRPDEASWKETEQVPGCTYNLPVPQI